MQRPSRVNPFFELLLQCVFGFIGKTAFCRFFPSKLGQDRQFALEILPGNSVPQSVFERENIQLLLLDTKNLSVWQPNNDFLRSNVDR